MAPLRSALASKDPEQIAAALDLPPIAPEKQTNASIPTFNDNLIANDGTDWSAVLNSWKEASAAAKAGNADRCYQAQSALHGNLNHIFGSSSGNFLVPALYTVCRNTHLVAIAADSKSNDKTQKAVNLLQESFSRCLNDRKEYLPDAPLSEEGSKKAGVLYIVNQLFSVYFRLNNLRLCKNLLRPVESRKLHTSGRMGDLVTYRYFVGRLHMFEDQYDLAEENLEYALKHCHKLHLKNKKCILRYLVPVQLCRGRLPTQQLLEKYGLIEFVPLVEGIRTGDLRTYNDGLNRYQDLFIRRGIYLLLEKCKTVCYRNLFKRVHIIMEKPQLNLKDVAHAFKWLGLPMDMDEVECILANLIYRGYIRGYISHSKRVLVLSKTNPFPTSAVIASKEC